MPVEEMRVLKSVSTDYFVSPKVPWKPAHEFLITFDWSVNKKNFFGCDHNMKVRSSYHLKLYLKIGAFYPPIFFILQLSTETYRGCSLTRKKAICE